MVSKLRRMGGDFGDFIPELLLEGFLTFLSFLGEWEGGLGVDGNSKNQNSMQSMSS